MIHITGLTRKQHMLMDVMWQFDTRQQVDEFIATLPTRDQQDCESLVQLAQWETLELEGALDDYQTHACMCIDHARRL